MKRCRGSERRHLISLTIKRRRRGRAGHSRGCRPMRAAPSSGPEGHMKAGGFGAAIVPAVATMATGRAWRGTAARDLRRHAAPGGRLPDGADGGQPETLAPLTAELTHLASFGRATLSLVLGYSRKVTVRP